MSYDIFHHHLIRFLSYLRPDARSTPAVRNVSELGVKDKECQKLSGKTLVRKTKRLSGVCQEAVRRMSGKCQGVGERNPCLPRDYKRDSTLLIRVATY